MAAWWGLTMNPFMTVPCCPKRAKMSPCTSSKFSSVKVFKGSKVIAFVTLMMLEGGATNH